MRTRFGPLKEVFPRSTWVVEMSVKVSPPARDAGGGGGARSHLVPSDTGACGAHCILGLATGLDEYTPSLIV